MWPMLLLEWDLKVKIEKKFFFGPKFTKKKWSKTDLSLTLRSNNLALLAK